MAAGTHAVGGRAAESNFRLERTGFAGRSPGALGGLRTVLRLPINKTLTLMILTVLMIGGLFAAAPLWGPFLTSEEMAFATLPMIGVAIAAPAFAGLCLLVRCQVPLSALSTLPVSTVLVCRYEAEPP